MTDNNLNDHTNNLLQTIDQLQLLLLTDNNNPLLKAKELIQLSQSIQLEISLIVNDLID